MKAANIGKILGAFGLLLLLSSPVTLFLTAVSAVAAGVKAAAGLVLLALYFATNYKQFGQFSTRRSSFFVTNTVLTALAVLGALGALNYIAYKKNKTWDLTAEKIFTLSPQTQSTVQGLKEPVRAIGFLPTSHPAYETLQDLFQRYQALAPEKFDYAFKDPRRHPDLAAKYQLREGQVKVVLLSGEGANESQATLTEPSEQALTNALLKMNKVGEQKVYFVVGHAEWPLEPMGTDPSERASALSEMKKQLVEEGYTPAPLNLAGKPEVPRDAALLIVAGAKAPFTAPEADAVRKYLGQGGRLLYFAEAQVDAGPELAKVLAEYGIEVDPGIAADAQYNSGSPYVVLSLFYSKHPVAQPLLQRQLNIEFPSARSLTLLRQGLAEGISVGPVVLTSPYAWVETAQDANPGPSNGEKTGQLTLVAASTRLTSGISDKRFDEARLIVVGDSDLLVDANWGHEANRNLVLNAIGWTTNQPEKITLRTPDRAVSTLQISQETMSRLRFISTDLLPLSLLGLGLAIWLSRRNK
jgi:ABC-type uncharacterized transport system involved in gliding motility auxiliary subunit